MGDRVSYYITAKAKGKTNDWQRARPVALYDAATAPYDPDYYLKNSTTGWNATAVSSGVKPHDGGWGELL